MPLTSVAQANSKTAEFARLFDLFDRVASRRTRRALAGGEGEVISADDIDGVPAEFAPVLQNLSTVFNVRALRDEEYARRVQTASTTRAHRNTLTIASPAAETLCPVPGSMDQEDHEAPAFPLGERYPFTFNLMLHKLYDLDEWAEKVKHAVETSKSQFKPLAERVQNAVKDATANIKRRRDEKKENNGVRGSSTKSKPLNTARHVRAAAMPSESPSAKTETSRVLKKRCIGRRKSVSGPMSTGVWVYDAAISATEVTVPRSAGWAETFSAPRRPSGMAQNRARHQSLPAFKLEEIQPRDSTRRKVKNASPQLRLDVFEPVTLKSASSSLSQEAIEAESVKRRARRGRSVAYAFTSEPGQRVTAKRPLGI